MIVKKQNNFIRFNIFVLIFLFSFLCSKKNYAQSINVCMKNAVEKGIKYNKILTICRENIAITNIYSNSYDKDEYQEKSSTYVSTNKTDKIIHEMIKGGDLAKAGKLATKLEIEKTKRIKARAEAEALRSPQIIATSTNSTNQDNTNNNVRSTLNLGSNPIKSVSAGSKILEITTPGIHGAIPGQFITISNVNEAIDGIAASEINKRHIISSVPSTTSLRVSVLSSATIGSITGGGNEVLVTFQN